MVWREVEKQLRRRANDNLTKGSAACRALSVQTHCSNVPRGPLLCLSALYSPSLFYTVRAASRRPVMRLFTSLLIPDAVRSFVEAFVLRRELTDAYVSS